MNTCPFGFNLQVLSETNDFMIGDEDQLLNKILSVPVKLFDSKLTINYFVFRKMLNVILKLKDYFMHLIILSKIFIYLIHNKIN